MQLKSMQLARRFFFLLFFPAAAFAQATYTCPANQYVTTQLVNTGQSCSPLPALPVSTVVVGTNSSGQVVAVPAQTAATVFAAPSGVAGAPSFRTLVASDIPVLNQNTTGTAANVTGVIAAAQLPLATSSAVGGVKCDGTTITCTSGVIAAVGGGGGSAVGAYLELAPAFTISVPASTTVWIGASNQTATSANSTLYYGTVQHNATITAIEYIVDTNGLGGFGSGQTGTFTLFDITTASTIAGSTTTPGINLNTPMVGEVTGLSAAVAAGDKLQATFTTLAGTTTHTAAFRAIVYLQ
ncbi:MAG TPA: hypothetical protein VFC39_16865 [Acidobacteriaceae bacterium]|nr:hypothetical protein [Acidobacteriaceae bacterium]